MATNKELKIIGQAEEIGLPDITAVKLMARIDTGARTSSVWVSSLRVVEGHLEAVFFAPEHPAYTGEVVRFESYETALVTSSTGHAEERFKVRLAVKLAGKKIRARFTLTDRSTQLYPVLIGRNVLRGKFVVDVKLGSVLRRTEEERLAKLAAKQQKEK